MKLKTVNNEIRLMYNCTINRKSPFTLGKSKT